MATNIEFALITRVIDEKDFHTLEKLRITEDYFQSPEVREVYKYLKATFHDQQTAGQVPSREMLKHRFPAFHFAPAYDTVPVLCSELRREKIRLELLNLGNELIEKAEMDPEDAFSTLKQRSTDMSSLMEIGEDLSMSSAYQQLMERYNLIAESDGVVGIPYPWKVLSDETQGMQNGQFIVWYGRPKSMKSWTVINCACHAYINARRRVLYYTREMPPIQIAQRAAACIAKLDYSAVSKGKLQPAQKKRYFDILRDLKDDEANQAKFSNGHNPYLIITTDRSAKMGGAGGGVSWLQAKIRDLKPDLVIVDGMYLLRDDRSGQRTVDWKAIAHISQDLKITAQEFDIPVVGVTQANRASDKSRGEDLTELAFSDSLGQDADAVFRVSKVKNKETQRFELIITAPGLREGVLEGIVVQGEPASSFDYLRPIKDLGEVEEDYVEAKKGKGEHSNGATSNGVQPTFGRKGNKTFAPVDPRIPSKLMPKA